MLLVNKYRISAYIFTCDCMLLRTNVYLIQCYGFFFPKKIWKLQNVNDNILYIPWVACPMGKSQKQKQNKKKKTSWNYLCRNIKIFLKSSQANGCLFNLHPYNKLFCRFCLFWGNISLFFSRHEVWMMQNSIWICKLNYLHNVLLISEYKFWSLKNWNHAPEFLKSRL